MRTCFFVLVGGATESWRPVRGLLLCHSKTRRGNTIVIVPLVGLGHVVTSVDGRKLGDGRRRGLCVELGYAERISGRHAGSQKRCIVLCT
jgi:hypothetical protein